MVKLAPLPQPVSGRDRPQIASIAKLAHANNASQKRMKGICK